MRNLFQRPLELRVVWAILPFVLLAGGMALLPLRSWDYWWHIAVGRIIDNTQTIPTTNLLLYTLDSNHPSFIQPWLSQWILFRLHEAIGLHGVLIFRNLATGAAFGTIGLWAARRSGSVVAGALLALTTTAFGFFCIVARSALPAWPWFLVVLWIAFRLRAGEGRLRFVVAIPLITMLWTNLHGSFLVPVAVSLAFLAAAITDRWFGQTPFDSTQVKRWAFILTASCAATIVNPRTVHVYGYLADLASNQEIRTTVSEWFPLTPFFPTGYGALFFVLAIGGLLAMARHRKELDPADLYLLLGFSTVALGQSRGLLWFGLMWPIVTAPYWFHRIDKREAETTPPIQEFIHLTLLIVMVGCALALQPWSGSNAIAATVQAVETRDSRPLLGLVTADTPVEPAQTLFKVQTTQSKAIRMFHDHRFAGFLLYQIQLTPAQPSVYVDHRIELPPPHLWRRFYALSAGSGWQEEFDQQQIDAALLSTENQSRLIEEIEKSRLWLPAFRNEEYVLFTRRQMVKN